MGIARQGRRGIGIDDDAVAGFADRDSDRQAAGLARLAYGAEHGAALAAIDVARAVDDRLGRVDRAFAERLAVEVLTLGILGTSQRILPAEIVPVVDMITERDDIAAAGKLVENVIGRRA